MLRIIHAIELKTESHGDSCNTLVAWLNRDGNSPSIMPIGKPRAIDLRIGDEFEHKQLGRHRITGISAFRDSIIPDAELKFVDGGYAIKVGDDARPVRWGYGCSAP